MEVADNKTQEWIRLFYGAHFLSAMCLVELMQVTWHILGWENLMDAKFTLRAGRAFASDLAHIALCRLPGCDSYIPGGPSQKPLG